MRVSLVFSLSMVSILEVDLALSKGKTHYIQERGEKKSHLSAVWPKLGPPSLLQCRAIVWPIWNTCPAASKTQSGIYSLCLLFSSPRRRLWVSLLPSSYLSLSLSCSVHIPLLLSTHSLLSLSSSLLYHPSLPWWLQRQMDQLVRQWQLKKVVIAGTFLVTLVVFIVFVFAVITPRSFTMLCFKSCWMSFQLRNMDCMGVPPSVQA